jgi:hypothetical protein
MGVEVSSVMDRCVTGSSDSLLLQVRKPTFTNLSFIYTDSIFLCVSTTATYMYAFHESNIGWWNH